MKNKPFGRKFIDISGNRYGRLVVIAPVDHKRKFKHFNCKCDCGKEKVIKGQNLRDGLTKSCGCFMRACLSSRNFRHGCAGNGAQSPEYRSWCAMRKRCLNPSAEQYENYGGRGIKICDRWKSFNMFLRDMGTKPSAEMTIERKNVNGNYEPKNCIWATSKEQGNNRRTSLKITFKGITKSATDWSMELGIPAEKIRRRISKSGWSIRRTLTTN